MGGFLKRAVPIMSTISLCMLAFILVGTEASVSAPTSSKSNVHLLYPGSIYDCCSNARSRQLQIYCYDGRPKHLLHIWQTVLLKLNVTSERYEMYDGATPDIVKGAYEQHRSSWNFNMLWGTWKAKEIKLSPFNRSCIGISSDDDYSVHLHVIRVDYWRVLLLVSGFALFLSAPRLSQNPLFYYICGISFGMVASFLILIYVVSRIFPRKPMMYGFVVGGWTVAVYLIQLLWDNIRVVIMEYRVYVASYAAVTGLISFIVCYRFGPVTDQRSKNLIKWALQAIPLVMILCSSHFQEATVAIVLILLAVYNFPRKLVSKAKSQWKRRFPPKVRPLTEDEYYEQGVRETKKALDELRGYCSSPDCNQWKTVIRLKDPVRFANFMEGTSHLDDNEVLDYESASARELQFTDESDSESDSVLTD